MRKKSMVFALSLILIVTLSLNSSAITDYKENVDYYTDLVHSVRATTTPTYCQPIYSSQALHQYGYITTIGISVSQTHSLTASASLTVTGNAWFGSVSGTMGLSQTQSITVGTSVSYTIPANIATGYYRISTAFPNSKVLYETHTADFDYTLTFKRTILKTPDTGSQYYWLENYIP